jgi:hypothetical protein
MMSDLTHVLRNAGLDHVYGAAREPVKPIADAVTATGEMIWDYDSHQSPMYYDLTVGGKTIEAVSHANKSSVYTVLNAATGKVISVSPHLTTYTEPHPAPTPAGVNLCPGFFGGVEFSPGSFDPRAGSVYQDALLVWSANLGLPYGSAPIIYQVGGTQYVAIVAGGSSGIPEEEGVPTGGELVVFKLGGSPVHTFPAINPLATLHAVPRPDLSQLTKLAPYVYENAAQKKALIQVVAAATPADGGFNFDGCDKGKANFRGARRVDRLARVLDQVLGDRQAALDPGQVRPR